MKPALLGLALLALAIGLLVLASYVPHPVTLLWLVMVIGDAAAFVGVVGLADDE